VYDSQFFNMPRRNNNNRRGNRSEPLVVSTVALSPSPSYSIPVEFYQTWTVDSDLYVSPEISNYVNHARMRPTSCVVTLASATPAVWRISAFTSDNFPPSIDSARDVCYQSRTFTTCGNSIDVHVRAGKSVDFRSYQSAGNFVNMAWVISLVSGVGGTASGTAMFGAKGGQIALLS